VTPAQITTHLRPDVAEELRAGAPTTETAAQVVRAVEERGAKLRPVESLDPIFVVDVDDEAEAESLRKGLEGLDGVEGAYIKPPEFPP
jgi:hypothetical protein